MEGFLFTVKIISPKEERGNFNRYIFKVYNSLILKKLFVYKKKPYAKVVTQIPSLTIKIFPSLIANHQCH